MPSLRRTRCQGVSSSASWDSTNPANLGDRLPARAATSPYVLTRPAGMAATVSSIRCASSMSTPTSVRRGAGGRTAGGRTAGGPTSAESASGRDGHPPAGAGAAAGPCRAALSEVRGGIVSMMSSQLLSAPEAVPGPAADLRLRRPAPASVVSPTGEQQAVIANTARRLRVLAGPGTGKTATLVEAVAERITGRGVAPEQILVLTFSRRAAAELTARITQRLGVTTREPIVRTLHGYAFAVLRRQAAVAGEAVPRLLAAGESDQVVRELLAGHLSDGAGGWPESLRPALASPSFAAELRDLMLRTAERGITPGRLAELGRRRHRPEWQAAARFAREYQDVADLRQGTTGLGPALDQAELTRAALALFADDAVLAQEQGRVRRLFVDEYQDVDPAQARLIERLASGADELVVFGDPDQSIYAFRGSQPGAMRRVEVDATVSLTASHRLAPAVLAATRRIAAALPGGWPHRELTVGGTGTNNQDRAAGDGRADDGAPAPDRTPAADGDVVVRTFPTAAGEAAFLADELRRAHLRGGVPWSRMAVLVRSPTRDLPPIRRALAAAGVPCAAGVVDPAADDPVVRVILAILRFGLDRQDLTGERAVELLTAPGIGLDPDGVRRLRRRLRAAHLAAGPTADLVAAAVLGAPLPDDLPADLSAPVLTARALLDLVGSVAAEPDPRVPLWLVWQRLGLADDLLAASLRGGRAGQRADRSLDAVLALFDLAGEVAERLPYAGIRAFVAQAVDRRIAVEPSTGDGRPVHGVALLSAHAAKGLEWDVVCLAGVSEGCWPVQRRPQSLLGLDELLDAQDGVTGGEPAGGPAEAVLEERRLFYVAATRARRRLVASSVRDQDTLPSRFLLELAGAEPPHGWPSRPDGTPRRSLQLAHLVADLRRVVTDPATPEDVARHAARQLARLAAAGVDGAHPRDWYGLSGPSTAAPPVPRRRRSPCRRRRSRRSCAARCGRCWNGAGAGPRPASSRSRAWSCMPWSTAWPAGCRARIWKPRWSGSWPSPPGSRRGSSPEPGGRCRPCSRLLRPGSPTFRPIAARSRPRRRCRPGCRGPPRRRPSAAIGRSRTAGPTVSAVPRPMPGGPTGRQRRSPRLGRPARCGSRGGRTGSTGPPTEA